MKCYTVYTDRVEPGILPHDDGDLLGILFGTKKDGTILPMDGAWATTLKELAIVEAHLDKKPDPENTYELRRFSNAEIEAKDEETFLVPKHISEEADKALVLVLPESEVEGAYNITAATWTEEWNTRREAVVRKYSPLNEAVGIAIAVEHPKAVLLIMERGASFRVAVTGADRKTRHFIYQWRDWKWPKLERTVPPTKKEAA